MAQQNEPKPAEADGKANGEANTGSSTPDVLDKDVDLSNLVPYGTRSRNRGGNSRPNYAEDRDYDVDMYDFDRTESKKAARQANATSHADASRASSSSRKPAAAGDDAKALSSSAAPSSSASQNGISKDQTPSGSTGSLQATQGSGGAAQPSKKRKAAAASSASASSQPTPNGNSTALTRKFGNGSQNSAVQWSETNMLTFCDSQARLQDGHLVADDGTILAQNDHVYLVCEPPGEPYYLGRIMEFLHPNNDTTQPIDALRINWYYRPRDIGRKVPDTRVVFATMHSDITPLTALRGKCQIRHRVDIGTPDAYRKNPDCFWFEKLYDRYIQKNYDLIPTSSIVNVPEKVKKVLDERWKFVLVEQGRGKELTSAVKSCKRCSAYCASNDSVDCAVCQNTYHMNCVKPPLLKKPSRGFAWSCAACSRAQERKLEARHTPNLADPYGDLEDDELLEEEEDDALAIGTGRTSPDKDGETHHQGTPEQIYQASLWPWRYLGMHCKPEDALDYDDRIYPRASTRIGPRHQAPVNPWPGKPVQYIKPPEIKKGKKDAKAKAEAHAARLAELYPDGKRPKWVQDTPPGYVARGESPVDGDDPSATRTLLWRPTESQDQQGTEKFLNDAQKMAVDLGLPEKSTNLRDVALQTYFRKELDASAALKALKTVDKREFKEPLPTPAEQKKFEEGIAKYGSELHLVMKHVKTMTPGQVVRYYYTWKKTERGQQVWGNYSGRKGKKEAKRAEAAATKLADDVADDDDDSAFDSNKAAEKKRAFMCQSCSTTTSRRWRRAPNATAGLVNENGVKATNKDKGTQFVVALCSRCAEIWRRYGIRWGELDEVAKKAGQMGGKGWKRKHEEELLKELQALEDMGMLEPDVVLPPPNVPQPAASGQEPPRKKVKSAPEKEAADSDGGSASGAASKKKEKEKVQEPPPAPEFPKPRTLPCAICDQIDPSEQHLSCRECRLAVHRKCYGVPEMEKHPSKWTCDMCVNDKNPQVSIQYKCVLCPVEHTEHDFVELPKLTHHKKKMTEKDRERERMEVQQARKAAEFYRKKQEELNRPINPREPLKRTADNNWVHVTCAVWTPEVKFGNAKAMEPSEGIPSVPRSRYDELCNACNQHGGACIPCQYCGVTYHVECARKQGHVLGFEITPVKSSRRDHHNMITIGTETGTMTASLWCKDHLPTKTIVHRIGEEVKTEGSNTGETLSYLQHFVQNFKQADLTLTGTVRKANLMTMAAKTSGATVQGPTRRGSVTTPTAATGPNGTHHPHRNGDGPEMSVEEDQRGNRVCISCGIDVSPRWWPIDRTQERELTNGHHGMIGSEAQKFVEQRKFQCHKCRKNHRTPVAHQSWPSSNTAPEAARPPMPETGLQAPQPPPLRSPGSGYPDNREDRPSYHGWAQHHPIHTGPQPIHTPHHSQAHITTSRPGPLSQTFPTSHGLQPAAVQGPPPIQAPPRSSYGNEWGNRPGSQHGTPPRHLNGGPPSLSNGPPMGNLSSLRPPNMVAPGPGPGAIPPLVPVGHPHAHGHGHGHNGTHSHGHTAPSYMKNLPPSPRRASGPAPPSPFAAPYQPAPAPAHAPPPPPPPHHAPHHGLSNGPPPPRPEPFSEPYPHGVPPQRSQYPAHPSPSGSAQGLPPTHDSRHPAPFPQRNGADGRPATGASASPSLRNLLS